MKKGLVILLCLLMTLMFTSCQIHIDTDPWPASPGYEDPKVTEAPVATPNVSPDETTVTKAPVVTDAPLPADEEPVVTPTPQPSNEVVEPGFNG